MITIRNEQMRILEASVEEAWLLTHLDRHFPEIRRMLGAAGMKRYLRAGLSEARGYGFNGESQIAHYLNVRVLLGEGFDRNQEWAAEILTAARPAPERVHTLVAEAERKVFAQHVSE